MKSPLEVPFSADFGRAVRVHGGGTFKSTTSFATSSLVDVRWIHFLYFKISVPRYFGVCIDYGRWWSCSRVWTRRFLYSLLFRLLYFSNMLVCFISVKIHLDALMIPAGFKGKFAAYLSTFALVRLVGNVGANKEMVCYCWSHQAAGGCPLNNLKISIKSCDDAYEYTSD